VRCGVTLVVALVSGACHVPAAGPTRDVADARPARLVRDGRGVDVVIPREVRRVATISDGLVEAVLVAVKAPVEVVAVGSTCLTRTFTYSFDTRDGGRVVYQGGQTPAAVLWPGLEKAPVVAMAGTEINLEQLAKTAPDVLLIHAGCCTTNWRADDRARMAPTLARLEALGIPTVVLAGPHFTGEPSHEAFVAAIRTIGEVVDRAAAAEAVTATLAGEVAWVRERTAGVTDAEKPRVLIFGLSPAVRRQGGAGTVSGRRSIESWLLEEVANARNAFSAEAYSREVNAEHVLALDPDAVLLPTASGFHPTREILEGPAFTTLQELPALRHRRVAALPWTPCNCDKRLEYPLDALVMAKLAYPERFRDVEVATRAEAFLSGVYRVDAAIARRIRRALWIDDPVAPSADVSTSIGVP
jgi:iron complex transport system substrate-binding protein